LAAFLFGGFVPLAGFLTSLYICGIDELMKRIYTAANLPEAALVRDLLQQAGIPAHILNQHAMGALGDLPMSEALPQVWIPQSHQELHALKVIAQFQSATANAVFRSNATCQQCHESNPAAFELCWNCGADLS
jgi:hypothetical protein